jgi:hypothetical protein
MIDQANSNYSKKINARKKLCKSEGKKSLSSNVADDKYSKTEVHKVRLFLLKP